MTSHITLEQFRTFLKLTHAAVRDTNYKELNEFLDTNMEVISSTKKETSDGYTVTNIKTKIPYRSFLKSMIATCRFNIGDLEHGYMRHYFAVSVSVICSILILVGSMFAEYLVGKEKPHIALASLLILLPILSIMCLISEPGTSFNQPGLPTHMWLENQRKALLMLEQIE